MIMNNTIIPLRLYNTATKKVEEFKPLREDKVRMYVCGPTVYDKPHIGNARPAIVFDVLYRLLMRKYDVQYVRNITDIDDKIINAAKQKSVSINSITSIALEAFESDMSALNVLPPTDQPKATEYVEQMCLIIKQLLEKGYAYFANNYDTTVHDGSLEDKTLEDQSLAQSLDIMFDVKHFAGYGCFMHAQEENHSHESNIINTNIINTNVLQTSDTATQSDNNIMCKQNKKNNFDFVLWKAISQADLEQALAHNYAWKTPNYMLPKYVTQSASNSNAGNVNQTDSNINSFYGRPGWHLECTAMSTTLLGDKFDIHGGGQDLMFPHHENERAQTCAYSGLSECCNYWMHNGLISYKDGKMSKSLGNIIYLDDIINDKEIPNNEDKTTETSKNLSVKTDFPVTSSLSDKLSFSGSSSGSWSALSIRFFLLQTHYRNILQWCDDAVELAHIRYTLLIKNLYIAIVKQGLQDSSLRECLFGDGNESDSADELLSDFINALHQDLNTSLAITILEEYVKAGKIKQAFQALYVLGLLRLESSKQIANQTPTQSVNDDQANFANKFANKENRIAFDQNMTLGQQLLKWLQRISLTHEQKALMKERSQARLAKNYALSDKLREELMKSRICVEDTDFALFPEGYFWYVK